MTLSAPATLLTAAVTLLAVLIALATAILVARTRRRVKIQPPAMTGAPELERALRVQGNTVEQFIIFLPALWLAALYFQGWVPPLIGLIWCLGRILYALGYMAEAGNARARLHPHHLPDPDPVDPGAGSASCRLGRRSARPA